MADFQIIRPESAHLESIRVFLKEHEKKNFFNINVDDLQDFLESCSFSAIFLQESDGAVYGLFASTSTFKEGTLVHALRCFMAHPLVEKAFLAKVATILFETIPHLSQVECAHESSFGYLREVGFDCGESQPSLQRSKYVSRLSIRPATVEDADQVSNLLKANGMQNLFENDFELSMFVEPRDPTSKSLLAETNGQVVAYVKCTNRVPLSELLKAYRLNAFVSGLDVSTRILKSLEHLDHEDILNSVEEVSLTKGISHVTLGSLQNLTGGDIEERQTDENLKDEISIPKVASLSVETIPSLFSITVFCIDPRYASQAHELLPALFSSFSQSKFCLLTLPSISKEIPLLENFILVPQRYKSSQCLYVCSRESLQRLDVVSYEDSQQTMVYEMIQDLPEEEYVIQELKSRRDNIYTVKMEDTIVGVILLSKKANYDLLKQYDFESCFSNTEETWRKSLQIKVFILDPIFISQTRQVLEQLLTVTESRILTMFSGRQNKATASLLKPTLFPIKPHKAVIPSVENTAKNVESVLEVGPLFGISVDSIYEKRIRYPANIVVIGNSTTALGFCEYFAMNLYLYMPNIILISSSAAEDDENSAFVDSISYWPNELRQIGILESVTEIKDDVVEIDRRRKILKTKNDQVLSYDYLIIAAGQQYYPSTISSEFEELLNVSGIDKSNEKHLMRSIDFLVHRGVRSKSKPDSPSIVIYGAGLDIFALTEYLLTRGFSPESICIVCPHSDILYSECKKTDDWIIKETLNLGVQITQGIIKSWLIKGKELQNIVVKGQVETEQTIECAFLYYADKKTTNPSLLHAINQASLVYDKHLVIDRNFKTHDRFILAGGTLTRYSSKFKTSWRHAYNESREVGWKMAEELACLFDPFHDEITSKPVDFEDCTRRYAKVPGNLHFFKLDRPHLPNDVYDVRKTLGHVPRVTIMETETEDGYFQVQLSTENCIRSILIMSRHPFKPSNFISLYNLPADCCNNMTVRFKENQIQNFLKYFNEPWAYALFDYRFRQILDEFTRSILAKREKMEIDDVISQLTKANVGDYANIYENFDQVAGKLKLASEMQNLLRPIVPGYHD